jgi:hypothetical protein
MEADIGPERRPGVSLVNSIVVPFLRFDDPLQIVRTRTTQHFGRSGELKNFADRVDVLYLARCQSAHQRTAIGLALDKPKPVKARQSFTNRVALYAEPVDQRVFDEALARMQEAEDYFLLKLAYQINAVTGAVRPCGRRRYQPKVTEAAVTFIMVGELAVADVMADRLAGSVAAGFMPVEMVPGWECPSKIALLREASDPAR